MPEDEEDTARAVGHYMRGLRFAEKRRRRRRRGERQRETDGEREWDRTRDGMKRGCYTSVFRARARARVYVYTCDKHTQERQARVQYVRIQLRRGARGALREREREGGSGGGPKVVRV